ncbi:MAG: Asp-tRNA(Asn)/Glu-tRNA(Gln) amidotransferase subunit GatC [Gemmatimonadota bacterium]|nr:Asp-tRNA(Asn)/Glu-tRNA(Gln) amidotransferase subunit GatC [Gemmatimonadota bacterium]
MNISIEDVRHIASLAHLGITDERATVIVVELNTILRHMESLAAIDTAGVQEAIGVGARGTPVRDDAGPPLPLAIGMDAFAPSHRDGFLLVPRLASHESAATE